jgi:hypothetical protein
MILLRFFCRAWLLLDPTKQVNYGQQARHGVRVTRPDRSVRQRNIERSARGTLQMKTTTGVRAAAIAAALIGIAVVPAVQAAPTITNGGFETGFVGWTTADQTGSDGTFVVQSGTASPLNLDPVPAPPDGTSAAMTDAGGPGSHVLYQDFQVTSGSATLIFDLFIGNRADLFAIPPLGSLDFALTSQTGSQTLNQQARVDIMTVSADPFSVAGGDVLANLYQTQVGDPLVNGYATVTADLSALFAAHAGETLRLRFAETDNVFTFQLGVDNVHFDSSTVPEPASALLFGAGLLALIGSRTRIRSRSAAT